MLVFRHADSRHPFLWEDAGQPPGRWHGPGEGPAHYFADTPNGAWAEFLRHEEIRDLADLAGIRRSLWAVELPEGERTERPALPLAVLLGGPDTYASCQQQARRLRTTGATRIESSSAALLPGGARGWKVDQGLKPGPEDPRLGRVIVLFGRRPDLVGWVAAAEARPDEKLLAGVRHFRAR